MEIRDMLDPERSLAELGLHVDDKVGIELRINYYQEQPAEEYVMPDTLELKITDARNEKRIVTVHVERPMAEKPYLGGFRNKQSGHQYHHAFTQTPAFKQKDTSTIKFHRECQT